MCETGKFIVAVLETIAHGKIVPKHIVLQNIGLETVFQIDKMRNDIETNKIDAKKCSKNDNPELFTMVTKSLTLLTMFPHELDELEKYIGYPESQLKQCLDILCGKEVVGQRDYFEIMKGNEP
jgi:hypothetical protein